MRGAPFHSGALQTATNSPETPASHRLYGPQGHRDWRGPRSLGGHADSATPLHHPTPHPTHSIPSFSRHSHLKNLALRKHVLVLYADNSKTLFDEDCSRILQPPPPPPAILSIPRHPLLFSHHSHLKNLPLRKHV